jgi:hypothetical protein
MRIDNSVLPNHRFAGIGQADVDYNIGSLRSQHEVLAISHRHGGW